MHTTFLPRPSALPVPIVAVLLATTGVASAGGRKAQRRTRHRRGLRISTPFEIMLYAAGCLGDLDGNHAIGQSDLGILLADYGCDGGPGCPGDADHDGDTDQSDLGLLLARYGLSCS